eukprot:TRINITY_DN4369_c0_g1_i1.p2 TRINITY_DN4369_c0_g1~~TRINITY_DN4369_c0_g1_i1.p2  ORF type:complete len:115 (-),score=2.12 TRINITY_DN4369_c0_g1_i1:27-371(-)
MPVTERSDFEMGMGGVIGSATKKNALFLKRELKKTIFTVEWGDPGSEGAVNFPPPTPCRPLPLHFTTLGRKKGEKKKEKKKSITVTTAPSFHLFFFPLLETKKKKKKGRKPSKE